MKHQKKVYMKMMGGFPTIGNGTRVNRPTTVYAAEKQENGFTASIFFLVRPKDCEVLKKQGFTIYSTIVGKGRYPIFYEYFGKKYLESRMI